MTARQQAPAGATLGYCLRCGGYGRGVYAGTINSYAEAIRDHRKCPVPPRRARNRGPVDANG
ncbi:hypothetical protein Kpho01_68140 [Kitasatospora phosalacinea]|uniref:Uncharacterized protein n=1 Tax=Kitasatospora phosalacinea TaxID=2065 RepID=A0A9W6PQ03_9ACTN|nr:hypothetical protein Kpho01_68140 [Kitasatospora phosalacinea]